MTRRDVVRNSLQHKKSHVIPYYIDFTINEYARMVEYYRDPEFSGKINAYLDTAFYGWFSEVGEKPEHFLDEFGVEWNRSGVDKDIGVIEQPLIEDIENCHLAMPKPDEARYRKLLEEQQRRREDKFVITGIGFTMFERAWSLLSIEELLVVMLQNPNELEKLLDQICEFDLAVIDIALQYDVDCIHFGDDWGQQKGLIMGPQLWRKFIKPRMKRLYERVKSAGKFVSQHSCGDIHEIFPDLIDIGLDMYQTFQPEIYDIEKVKAEFGAHLTFWGGISTQTLLPVATPEEVRRETVRIMRIMGEDGGYVAAPTHSVPGDVPPENIDALLDVFQNQNKYL